MASSSQYTIIKFEFRLHYNIRCLLDSSEGISTFQSTNKALQITWLLLWTNNLNSR
jgi:hypothetical protein